MKSVMILILLALFVFAMYLCCVLIAWGLTGLFGIAFSPIEADVWALGGIIMILLLLIKR